MTDTKQLAINDNNPIDWTAPEMMYLAPEDYVMPPADPVLLASANRMLSDRLERVAHVLRGCGLPALTDVGHEDLQMAAAALSGAYQMALADAAAVPDLRNITAELEATVALQRETLVTAAADVSRLSAELATERRVSGSAISAVASICEHLGCDDHNGHVPVLRAIDDLRAELAVKRQACKALREQINSAPSASAKGYVLKIPKRAMRSFGKEAAAQSAAMAAARAGKAGEVFALVPVGKAVRGAEWRVA